MTIAIASDHAGFDYKEMLKEFLHQKGYQLSDFGTDSDDSCDYPDFVIPAASAVAEGSCDCGIVLGGSGNGEAIAANKVKGVRCGVCWNEESAYLTKRHNNANVIALGQRMVDPVTAKTIVVTWLDTTFEGKRHEVRIAKLEA